MLASKTCCMVCLPLWRCLRIDISPFYLFFFGLFINSVSMQDNSKHIFMKFSAVTLLCSPGGSTILGSGLRVLVASSWFLVSCHCCYCCCSLVYFTVTSTVCPLSSPTSNSVAKLIVIASRWDAFCVVILSDLFHLSLLIQNLSRVVIHPLPSLDLPSAARSRD